MFLQFWPSSCPSGQRGGNRSGDSLFPALSNGFDALYDPSTATPFSDSLPPLLTPTFSPAQVSTLRTQLLAAGPPTSTATMNATDMGDLGALSLRYYLYSPQKNEQDLILSDDNGQWWEAVFTTNGSSSLGQTGTNQSWQLQWPLQNLFMTAREGSYVSFAQQRGLELRLDASSQQVTVGPGGLEQSLATYPLLAAAAQLPITSPTATATPSANPNPVGVGSQQSGGNGSAVPLAANADSNVDSSSSMTAREMEQWRRSLLAADSERFGPGTLVDGQTVLAALAQISDDEHLWLRDAQGQWWTEAFHQGQVLEHPQALQVTNQDARGITFYVGHGQQTLCLDLDNHQVEVQESHGLGRTHPRACDC